MSQPKKTLVNIVPSLRYADAAKAIAMGCSLVTFGLSVGLAMGGRMTDRDALEFASGYSSEELYESARNFMTACSGEATMMARCTGKTNIHSLEPEDLRSITHRSRPGHLRDVT